MKSRSSYRAHDPIEDTERPLVLLVQGPQKSGYRAHDPIEDTESRLGLVADDTDDLVTEPTIR